MLLLSSSCSFFVKNSNKTWASSTPCNPNADTTYNRVIILQKLADALNESVPEFRQGAPQGFTVEDGKCLGFCTYDLVDILNIDTGLGNQCIKMIDNHVYHFVPVIDFYAYSHIAILTNGNIKIFYSVNCESKKRNNIEDVLREVNLLYANHPRKDYILRQVKNYRKYRFYIQMDAESAFVCK